MVRRATAADAGPLAALAERTFLASFADENAADDMDAYVREAFTRDAIQDELAAPASRFFLAHDPGAGLVGYAKLRTAAADASVTGPDPVELHRLYVDAPAIGRGVGARLMQACLDAARTEGYQTIWLGVWERNPRAIRFYERWGFRVVGAHLFRLGTDDQTDLVMERPIDSRSPRAR